LSTQWHIDLSPTTDARPFFFYQLYAFNMESLVLGSRSAAGVLQGNFTAEITLVIIMCASLALVAVTIIFPARASLLRAPPDLAKFGTSYFLLIGLGFMFIEIGLIQRLSIFLGHPVYGLAVGLFGIIFSTGVGSLISERVRSPSVPIVTAWASVLALNLALLPFWLPRLTVVFEPSPLAIRVLASLTAIVPCGALMGMGFPMGMRITNAVDARPAPWFWAVNGAAGVLAAGLATASSISFSINVSLWIGAACYLALVPVIHRLRKWYVPGVEAKSLA